MSQSLCVRCLRRSLNPSIPPFESNATARAAFSTTSILSAPPKTVKAKGKGKQLVLSRNTRSAGKAPASGERKAFKKRVVLSNTNALEVKELQDLSTTAVNHLASLRDLQGQVRAFSDETVDVLRALEAFQTRQAWSLFRRPATVIRQQTIELAELMSTIEMRGQESTFQRGRSVILDGQKATGKSVLLLQALAMAQLKGWIVVHFPDAQELINAHTSYAPLQTPQGTRYTQPHYTAQLLGNIVKANGKVLSKMQLSMDHDLPISVQANISLDRFAMLGAEDRELAWPIFQALWSELTAPSGPTKDGLQRPPIFVGLDGLSHIMGDSAYLDADAQPVHAHDLLLVQTFISALSKRPVMPNGSLTVAAMSGSHRPRSFSLELCLDPREYKEKRDPYFPYDKRVTETFLERKIQRWTVEGITKEEARAVMEYWARSGILRATVTDTLVNDQWSVSGGGIIGELERATVRAPYFHVP